MRIFLRSASRVLVIAAVACGLGLAAGAAGAKAPHHWPHVRFGGFSIGAGYSYFGGPAWGYPYGAWSGFPYDGAFFDPMFYSPYIAPGYFSGFAAAPGYGEVKLKSTPKGADVFIDGAYAGSSDKLKQMWLEPGVYRLEVQQGTKTWTRKVYVLSGRSLDITPQLADSAPPAAQP